MQITAEQLQRVCPDVPTQRLASIAAALTDSFALADITTPARAAHYVGQTAQESKQFARTEEDLNYSAERIVKVWPHRFASVRDAAPFAHNPQALANRVYSSRLGNGDDSSGDGWKYRGRGWIMLTGCDTFHRCGLFLGVDLRAQPELVSTPKYAALTAAWFWRTRGINRFADAGDVEGCTRAVQGADEGLEQRRIYTTRALVALTT